MKKRTKSIKFPLVINPFFVYAIIWSVVLLIRSFHIDKLYPVTPINLWIFIFLTIVISIMLGLVYNQMYINKFKDRCIEITGDHPFYFLTAFCVLGLAASIVYSGGIPLLATLAGTAKSYKEFGIPTLTPLVICATLALNVISSVKFFYGYKKRLANFLIIVICYIMFLLIFSRGALIICVASSFFVMISRTKFTFKKLIFSLGIIILGAFLFNVLGNIRQQAAWNDSSFIMMISKFDKNYSWLSNFSWGIVYVDSPLGNLAYNMEYVNHLDNASGLISQLLPDLISKRIFPDYSSQLVLANEGLNVASMYSGSYKYFGLFGMGIHFIFISLIIFIVAELSTRRTETFLISSAYLSVLALMTFFDNSFSYSGFSFALLVILLFDCIRYPNARDFEFRRAEPVEQNISA